MAGDLYHGRVLELAANIEHVGRLENADASVEKRARICGSTVRVDVTLSKDGQTIAGIAVEPRACALGQAATAILSEHAVGASIAEVRSAQETLVAMLKNGGPPPTGRFAELRYLQGVADYPPRHASTTLAFDAAVDAIEAALAKRSAPVPSDA